MSERVVELARTIMQDRGFESFSAFVEQLIRDEYDHRTQVSTRPTAEAMREPAAPCRVSSGLTAAQRRENDRIALEKLKRLARPAKKPTAAQP